MRINENFGLGSFMWRKQRIHGAISAISCIAFLAAFALPVFAQNEENIRPGSRTPKPKLKVGTNEEMKAIKAPDGDEQAEPRKYTQTLTPNAGPVPQQPVDPNAPRIAVDEAVRDFGTIWSGPLLRHEFVIRNDGKSPLEITKVRPACGCTVAGSYPKTIAPGESGRFPFTIDSSKLRSRFEKPITISSNDPATPDLLLKLAGDCKRYVEVTPPSANFTKVVGAETREQKITLTNNSEQPIQMKLEPLAEGSRFAAELSEKTPGNVYELTVRMNPPYQVGTWRDQVKVSTNHETFKQFDIPVLAVVPERLELQPAEVTIPAAIAGKPAASSKRVLRFNNYGDRPAKVLEAAAADERLKVTVAEQVPGKAYNIEVEWPAEYAPPEHGTMITLKTDDPDKPTISVPVKSARVAINDPQQQEPRGAATMIGKPAPAFTLKTTEGKTVTNADLSGKVGVLNFFAVNCPHCKKQMPRIESLRTRFEDKGVRFINVCQTMRKAFTDEEVINTVKGINVHAELAIDSGNTVGPLFLATSFPTMVLIGKSGTIEAVNSGNMADLETRLAGQLDALVAGRPVTEIKADPVQAPPPQPSPDAQAKQPEEPKPVSADSLIGKPAPKFDLKTFEGKSVNNAELAKAPATVLNFVAPNCGYCKKQLPRMETLRPEFAEKGVRFVNVIQKMGQKDFSDEEVVETFKSTGANFETARDANNAVGGMFGARGFPTMVIVGKSGNVEAVNVGNIGDLETRVKAQLTALVEGKPVPKFENPQQQRPATEMIGKSAPEFTLTTLDGKTLASADFGKNAATVLNFVAPNCGFCKKQVPVVEAIRKEYEAKGVRFCNVNQTMRQEFTNEQIVEVFKNAGSNLEIAPDAGNKVGQAFKATSYPTMVIVGKDGKVAQVNIGAAPDLDTKLRQQLDALIQAKP